MKALNCANCGANLKYTMGMPVAFCPYCKSINVLDNVQVPFGMTNSKDAQSYYEELKPRVLLPQEKFTANYKESAFNAQGGNLWIANTEIFFKPDTANYGNLSNKFMKISDIVSMNKTNEKFGLSRILTIKDKNRNLMKLVSWNRDEIISGIKKRKRNLK